MAFLGQSAPWTLLRLAGAAALLAPCLACIVPQPRGAGQLERLVEPTVQRGYWRYLPKGYEPANPARPDHRYPLVMTFHGMKPFDTAIAQGLEWQQEADRYGFVVVVPELIAPDVLEQFPVRTIHPDFRADETASLAIMDHIFQTTNVDPAKVLSTSWSSGGYMAHYMMNHHPERFTCLAVRQSNFSATILDSTLARRSIYNPVLIVNTEKDFDVCKRESLEARQWYAAHGYRNLLWVFIKDLGHERTPELAADFFSRVVNAHANHPPSILAKRQAIDGNTQGLALLAGRPSTFVRNTSALAPRSQAAVNTSNGRRTESDAAASAAGALRNNDVVAAVPSSPDSIEPAITPERGAAPPARSTKRALTIRATPRTGIEPLFISFSAECPADWQQSAEFQWTLNGSAIAKGLTGQQVVSEAGDHTLALTVVAPGGEEHHAVQTIRVLPRSGTQPTFVGR